jgi:hypothetical protein
MMQYESPPYAYAGVCSEAPHVCQETAQVMQKDAEMLFDFEHLVHLGQPAVARILDAAAEIFSPATRITYATFERDLWKPDSLGGCRHVKTLIKTLPDSKCIEDGHGKLRDLERNQKASRVSRLLRSSTLTKSGILERRLTPNNVVKCHKAAFIKNMRVDKYRRTSLARAFVCESKSKHELNP